MRKMFIRKEPRIPFTKDGYAKILEERAKLLSERPEAVEHLRKSREMGDLSENGYYKASRARLSFLDGQIRRIERLVRLGVVVESSKTGQVDIGSTVTITDGTKEYTYAIVGGYESDPSAHTISHFSPIGKALLHKRVQDTTEVFTPSGVKKYIILKIA